MDLNQFFSNYTLYDGFLINRRGNRNSRDKELWKKWNDFDEENPLPFKEFKAIAVKHLTEIKKVKAEETTADFGRIETPQAMIVATLVDNGVNISEAGNSIIQRNTSISLETVKHMLIVFTEEYNRSIPKVDGKMVQSPWKTSHVVSCLAVFLSNLRIDVIGDLREKFVHNGEDWKPMMDEVLSILGARDRKELSAVAFAHWMWTVKRHIYRLPIKYPLMFIIHGAQGKGKSFFVKHCLCAPLKDFYLESDLKSLADEREVGKWTQYFVVNFDEISFNTERGNKDGRLANIRRKLTEEDITTRVMGSHEQIKKKRTFGAMGTSNQKVSKVMGDPLGMRRFYELESFCEESQYDSDRLGAIDFLEFWKSIDETLEDGYLSNTSEYWEELQEVQKTYVPETNVDHYMNLGNYEFVAEEDFTVGKNWSECVGPKDCEHMAGGTLYKSYSTFCDKSSYKKMSLTNFSNHLLSKKTALFKPRPESIHFVVKPRKRS